MDNLLLIKSINELRNMNFFVPAYQRGYRWNKKQVLDLLNDIDDFNPETSENTKKKTWYCLQPIVVKKNADSYEVIDGQQRLTTIYLILHYFNSMFVEGMRKKLFSLNYETRDYLPKFLNSLSKDVYDDSNVDFYYISEAYKTILDWFRKEDLDVLDFQSKFDFNTKVIWFESSNQNPIDIFTRINMGKIPLTNAELIKALFLRKSNFKSNNKEKVRLKQLEISGEWDRIERGLQDDSFWYFITNGKLKSNRIDYIFNIMTPTKDVFDQYSAFRYFSTEISIIDEQTLEKEWLKVKNYYQKLHEWYDDRELFHKIGFLIFIGQSIENILKISENTYKNEFMESLNRLIKNHFKNTNLDELTYGDNKVKDILLLYNIQTMLNNNSENSRFPFDIFKNNNWDIEHITSVKDKMPENENAQKLWLEDSLEFIEDEYLGKKASKFKFKKASDFTNIYNEIIDYFNKHIKEIDINDISNLALLDSQTNRGYKNAVFPVKRLTIINKEKTGNFIPLCTKNAFLKYFSEYPPKMSFWTQEDRTKYFNDIKAILTKYLKVEGV